MTTHIQALLSKWYATRHENDWVLATVIDVKGSNYRKKGAMMLFSHTGEYYGLVSGGCLERALALESAKVLALGKDRVATYDSTENGDSEWQISLGCGGVVTIALQKISPENQFLHLDRVYEILQKNHTCRYEITLSYCRDTILKSINYCKKIGHPVVVNPLENEVETTPTCINGKLNIYLHPKIRIIVFGAGIDTIPLVSMAKILGWHVIVVDQRLSSHAKLTALHADQTFTIEAADIDRTLLASVDAAIIMTHNLQMDAEALKQLQNSPARYIGLLGPSHRRQKVLSLASLREESFQIPISGPMGIDIGNDALGGSPESVALSSLAECHYALFSTRSL